MDIEEITLLEFLRLLKIECLFKRSNDKCNGCTACKELQNTIPQNWNINNIMGIANNLKEE